MVAGGKMVGFNLKIKKKLLNIGIQVSALKKIKDCVLVHLNIVSSRTSIEVFFFWITIYLCYWPSYITFCWFEFQKKKKGKNNYWV